MMKITINAFGTRGDVQPYVALGLGLMRAGHQVRFTTHRIFEEFVRGHGFDYYPLEIDSRQVLVNQAVAQFGGNTFRLLRWMRENFEPALGHIFQTTLEAAEGADLMINSALSFAGWHVAQKLGTPALAAYLQPATPTSEHPSAAIPLPPAWLPFKGLYNYTWTKLSNQLFFATLLKVNNACRKEVLELPPLNMAYYWRIDAPDAGVPFLYGYSPSVIPKPSNWGSTIEVTGYWFLDQKDGYQSPPELEKFLDTGAKPIYLGFGSMVDHERERFNRLVIGALQMVGARGVLYGGWSELGDQKLPDSIMRVDYVPHDWLFPQVAAVVHHGGAGTTAAGMRAGVPTIVVPFFGDQPFWGWRVQELGVGPKPVPRKALTAEKLAEAIDQATQSAVFREKAAQLGARIQAEDGVQRAVDLIHAGFGMDFVV
jgi:UDP:flavonoid glycosyltransferase YjiC (YdhE family)